MKSLGIVVKGAWALSLLVSLALGASAAEQATVPRDGGPGGAPSRLSSAAQGPGIWGKVLFEGKPAAGVRMHVYLDSSTDFKGQGHASSGPTAEDGRFAMTLKPGRYYLVGKKSESVSTEADPDVGELFGFYGGNPIKVSEESNVEVNLQVVRRKPATVAEGEGPNVAIEGLLVGPRGPAADAAVFAYPDSKSDFRGPDLTGPQGSLVGGTGPDGHFSLELPAGTYYLTAAKRRGGMVLGPLQAGDLFGYFDGNPLRLQAGQKASITIQMTEKLRQHEAPAAMAPGATAISGRILDPSGRPVAGVFAFATTDPNLIGTMPPYLSRPVGQDGVFSIEVPGGGTFFVGARTGFGGPPQPGQWQGMLGDDNIRPVTIEKGKVVDNVDITVRIVE